MINSEKTVKEIAEEFNLTQERIRQIIKNNNIDIAKLRNDKYKVIAQEINYQIKHGACHIDIYKNYNKKTIDSLKRNGLELLYKSRIIRDRKIAHLYKKGLTAKEILSIGICGITTPEMIYKIIAKQNAKRNPFIIRGEKSRGDINENKKILTMIKKLRNSGLTFQKISDYLNKKGYKTITGKPFSFGLTYAKYKQAICKKTS